MPFLMKTVDQIMRERQADGFFLHFDLFDNEHEAEIQRQLAWLIARGITYEVAAPEGWLEGNPGCYAVYFADRDDPRLAAYSARFEDASGGSLRPELYQMYLMPFELWARRS